jgi:proline iminopeptidase
MMFASCHKEEITVSSKAEDVFFLEEKGVSMPIQVFGNTASKTFLLMVHGGPGGDALIYRDEYVKKNIETEFAMVNVRQVLRKAIAHYQNLNLRM